MADTKTARAFKKWRGKRTQQDAANELGVAMRTYWRWESGECEPSKAYRRLLQQMGVKL